MGTANPSLRAEITLGLQAGDRIIEKTDVLRFLAGSKLPLRITQTELLYSRDGQDFYEAGLILSSDRNPRYNVDLYEDEWKELVKGIARKLAREFAQQRVYVTFSPVEVVIITQE